jgi:glycerol-3-phosphate dehydrogenase
VASGLFEAELHYLHEHEWARSAEDVLWRCSKLGLHLRRAQQSAVADWCAAHWGGEVHWGDRVAHGAATARTEVT